ncbi:MAG: hypothetical protein ACRY3E_06235 [Candidatus Lariskella arthropodorum]
MRFIIKILVSTIFLGGNFVFAGSVNIVNNIPLKQPVYNMGNVYNSCNKGKYQITVVQMSRQQDQSIMQFLQEHSQDTNNHLDHYDRNNPVINYQNTNHLSDNQYNQKDMTNRQQQYSQQAYQNKAGQYQYQSQQTTNNYNEPQEERGYQPYGDNNNQTGQEGQDNEYTTGDFIVKAGTSLLYNINTLAKKFGWTLINNTNKDIKIYKDESIPLITLPQAIKVLTDNNPIQVTLYKKNKVIVVSINN